jgi:hypothetical protein
MNSVYAKSRIPQKTVANQFQLVDFRMHFQSYIFKKGHTLRLSVSNGEWRAWNRFPVKFSTFLSCGESSFSVPIVRSWPSSVVVNAAFTQVPVDNTDAIPPNVVLFPNVSSSLHVTLNDEAKDRVLDIQFLSCALFVCRNNFIATFYGMMFDQNKNDPSQFRYCLVTQLCP